MHGQLTRLLTFGILARVALCLPFHRQASRGKTGADAHGTKPHIVFLLADDLGYALTGFSSPGAEVLGDPRVVPKTPTIDKLRSEGAALSNLYAYKFCSPSRSSLLTGRLPMHVNQNNVEVDHAGGGIPLNMTTIAQVLKRGGYKTHAIGKWHCGASHVWNLPTNRGFDSFYGLLGGMHGHFDQKKMNFVDLWRNSAPATGEPGHYSGHLFTNEAVRVIQEHDPETPFFLYMSYVEVHEPYEAPDRFANMYAHSIFSKFRYELAMVSAMDAGILNIANALKDNNMYNNTLIVFSSDNGGVANNYPFRGRKGSYFDGGVRVVAFVSGGFLPKAMHGSTIDGLMHFADFYATFARLAGVEAEDTAAPQRRLPPIDSMDMLDVLTGTNATSPRRELPLGGGDGSTGALIWADGDHQWKLIRGDVRHADPPHPRDPVRDQQNGEQAGVTSCKPGCLFDLNADVAEQNDLKDKFPDQFHKMMRRAKHLDKSCFQSRFTPTPAEAKLAVAAAKAMFSGHWGPWQSDQQLFGMGDSITHVVAAGEEYGLQCLLTSAE